MIEKLFTVEEVAELASVTGRTIRNYLKSGRLVGRKIGGQWRFPEAEVQRLLTGGGIKDVEADDSADDVPPAAREREEYEDYEEREDPPARPREAARERPPLREVLPRDPYDDYWAAPLRAEPRPREAYYSNPPRPTGYERPYADAPPAPPPYAPAESVRQRPYYAEPAPLPVAAPPAAQLLQPPAYAPQPAPAPVQPPAYQSAAQALTGGAAYAGLQTPFPPGPPAPGNPAGMAAPAAQAAAPSQPEPPPVLQSAGAAAPQAAQPQAAEAPAAEAAPSAPATEYAVPAPYPAPYMGPLGYPAGAVPAYPFAAPGALPPFFQPAQGFAPYYMFAQPAVAMPGGAEIKSDLNTDKLADKSDLNTEKSTENAEAEALPEENPQPDASPAPEAESKNDDTPQLSDVGRQVMHFVSEVHDCSAGPIMCAVVDLHQSLSAARVTSERLNDIADQESEKGQPCQCFVEFDDRFFIARYTLFGATPFLLRCLKLIG